MAKLRTKQILNFATDVISAMDSTVGTGVSDAISVAKSEAVSAASTDATSKANAALSDAKVYADDAEADALSDAKVYANGLASNYDIAGAAATAEANAKAHSDIQKLRIDALLQDSTTALDTFAEIESFIGNLSTADINGLIGAISDAKSEAISTAVVNGDLAYDVRGAAGDAETNAREYTNTTITNLNFGDIITYAAADFATAAQGDTADSALQPGEAFDDLGLTVSKDELNQLTGVALGDIVTYNAADFDASGDAADALSDAKVYADDIETDLQSQIDSLSGVSSREEFGAFANASRFITASAFDVSPTSEVDVFINGLQVHRAVEDGEGWTSLDGRTFNLVSLGYDIDENDHIIVSGKVA